MKISSASSYLREKLWSIYDSREASNISSLVIENLTGMSRSQVLVDPDFLLSQTQQTLFEKYTAQLLAHRPLQYVLHEAWFSGMKFFVDENVLIPRPETEELVEWAVATLKSAPSGPARFVLDIGTGSGCIAIAIKKACPEAEVWALDISNAALNIAGKNADSNHQSVHFQKLDITNESKWETLPVFDLVVSNPPYIPFSEKETINANVLKYEPHTALFVPDDDPLKFYKKIAAFFLSNTNHGATLFFETHEIYGQEVKILLENIGCLSVELKKDLQEKERMVKAVH